MEVPIMTDVKPIEDMNLIVYFEDGTIKKYDIKQLFDELPLFKELQKNDLFNKVKVDIGGFGLVWNAKIDLSRYEIWINGEDYTE